MILNFNPTKKSQLMIRCIKIILLLFFNTIYLFSQIDKGNPDHFLDSSKHWKYGGILTLNGQQVSLTNWFAGGQNSISGGALTNLFIDYKKGNTSWENNFELAYGVVRQGDNKEWWKNDDRIQLTSKLGKPAFNNWHYSCLIDFKTQFAAGFNYPNDSVLISNFLAPGFGLVSLGMDYKPSDDFSLYLAPASLRFTIVNDQKLADEGAFGVTRAIKQLDTLQNLIVIQKGKKSREEIGGYLKFTYRRVVMENVDFSTTLELFSNYLVTPQNIDVNWTTLTTMKVNKHISANFSTHLIYDDDIDISEDKNQDGITDFKGPRIQFKQVLAVGFNYRF